MTLFTKTATELQSLLHNREVSVKELTEESLARIAKVDGDVKHFCRQTRSRHLPKQQNWTTSRSKDGDHFLVYQSD